MTDPSLPAQLRRVVTEAMPRAISELTELVAIPSVSWPSFDQAQVRRSAEAIATLAGDSGVFDEVNVRTAAIPGTAESGQPAVLATRAGRPGERRVLLYAHHDVQPVGDEAAWLTPPFRATEKDGRLYGRGTADDKAGVLTHLASLRALREVLGDELGIGITLFVEGEEEYGSRSFGQFLSDHRGRTGRRPDRGRRLRQLGFPHAGHHRRAAGQHPVHADRANTRPRTALRHVRRRGPRRDAGHDQAARHAVGRARHGRGAGARPKGRAHARLRRGPAARRDGPAGRYPSDRFGRPAGADLEPAVDHGDGNRLPWHRGGVQHPEP